MIEQYLRRGVRLLWTKPNDGQGANDGSIVPSLPVPTPMHYDGLDAHQAAVDPALLAVHASAVLGLAMRANVPYDWLAYAPGCTTQVAAGGGDVLTGYMSGCLVVRGTWNGFMSVFHVGTVSNNIELNRSVKQAFLQSLPADAVGFDPAGAWTAGEIAAIQANLGGIQVAREYILGLVTAAGVFHSILAFNVSENNAWNNPAGRRYWCIGGQKPVAAMNRIRLRGRLLT